MSIRSKNLSSKRQLRTKTVSAWLWGRTHTGTTPTRENHEGRTAIFNGSLRMPQEQIRRRRRGVRLGKARERLSRRQTGYLHGCDGGWTTERLARMISTLEYYRVPRSESPRCTMPGFAIQSAVLSEHPEDLTDLPERNRWGAAEARHRTRVDGTAAPHLDG